MSDDLVKRLLARPMRYAAETEDEAKERRQNDCHEAARALVAKDAEIARLRGFINDLIDAAENDRRRAQHKGETP